MPATSKKQFRFMQAVAHGIAKKKPKGLSMKEAREFVSGQSPKGLPQKVKKNKKYDMYERARKSHFGMSKMFS